MTNSQRERLRKALCDLSEDLHWRLQWEISHVEVPEVRAAGQDFLREIRIALAALRD